MVTTVLIKIICLLLFLYPPNHRAEVNDENDWWRTASFYQIYPRSFQDSNGDGTGDLRGITLRLGYLKELGIDGTWLSPIFKSPMHDNGYDISNFMDIDPIFGTLEDFKELLNEAKKLNLKLVLDFVPNHSSDLCEWFEKSVQDEEYYRDFYIWHDGKPDPNEPGKMIPPNNWLSAFNGSAWTWNEQRQQFYYHTFLPQQPDFNFRNEKVLSKMKEILKFWLDLGVHGFRIDAFPHFIEKELTNSNVFDEPKSNKTNDSQSYDYLEHIYTTDLNETTKILYDWRKFIDQYSADNSEGGKRILMVESFSSVDIKMTYYGNGVENGSEIPFNFILMDLNDKSNARNFSNKINEWITKMPIEEESNWVLGNHDFPRIPTRFSTKKANMLNMLLLTLPGISVTYYGEEIGMIDVQNACHKGKCDFRDPERTPMQWSSSLSAGFSTNTTTWLNIADDYKERNVEVQREIINSPLNIFKKLLKLRKTESFISRNFRMKVLSENVLLIIRNFKDEFFVLLLNFSGKFEVVVVDIFNQNDLFECILTNEFSEFHVGEQIKLNEIFLLGPYEALMLKRISVN